jgi:hypothetical protein
VGTSPIVQTLSFHAKANGRTKLYISNGITVNLSDGTYSGTGYARITALADDWYRVETSYRISATSITWEVLLVNNADATTYTGDGSSGILLRMLQVEPGPDRTSYIPTTTVAVTRNADVLEYDALISEGYLEDGYATMYMQLAAFKSIDNHAFSGMALVPTSTITGSSWTYDLASYKNAYENYALAADLHKLAIQYTDTTLKEYSDGASVQNMAYATSTGLEGFLLPGDTYRYHLQVLAFFPYALLNAELMSITT